MTQKHQNPPPFRGRAALIAASFVAVCGVSYIAWKHNSAPADASSGRSSAQNLRTSTSAESRGSAANAGTETQSLWQSPSEFDLPALSDRENAQDDETASATHGQKYRKASIAGDTLIGATKLKKGDLITIPLPGGENLTGRVSLVQADQNGWIRTAGSLTGKETGSFVIGNNGAEVSGTILRETKQLGYELSGSVSGIATLSEKPIGDVICTPLPANEDATGETVARSPSAAPPILSSRPNATAVAYLDFDGEVVTDPHWNRGNTINAAPSPLTNAQITEFWSRVKEDFAAFDIDVTTDPNRYANAPVTRRTRCIVTPTNTAQPGAGGVAYLNTFSRAGSAFSSTIPCWVFNSGVKGGADAATHEIGHTLGLNHDGRTSPAEGYYTGHGEGAVGWAPIMGVGYYKSLVQWSKGEYANANNREDDIAIITNSTNGFGFVPDDAGNTPQSAAVLNAPAGTVNQHGLITSAADVDYFTFDAGAGNLTLNAVPAPASESPGLDVLIELRDSTNAVIATANPDTALNASISQNIAAGTYYITVRGTGRGSVTGDGYSNYGSIGAYSLSGSFVTGGNPVQTPVITSAGNATGTTGQAFTYQIAASNSPTSYSATGLPAGLAVNSASGLISGTPTNAGNTTVTLGATNSAGTGNATLALTINAGVTAPTITSATTASGFTGQAFSYQIVATGNPTSFSATGLPAGLSVNTNTGRISGTPTTAGTSNIALRATNSAGTGNATLALTVNATVNTPVITSSGSASGTVGQAFTYQITANNGPTSYSATGLPAGLAINTSSGLVSGTPTVAGTSTITLGATNSAGTGSAQLSLVVAPVSTGNEFANTGVITIRDRAAANPYPSTINVSGLTGTISKVTVTLKGLSHTYPDDVDFLVVAPNGRAIMLASDAGGGNRINNVTLTFDDAAFGVLPDSTAITSGTYKPSNNEGRDYMPSPVPYGNFPTALSSFNGLNPNGQWRIYIADDARGDIGSIAQGWSIKITTSANATVSRR